MFKRLFISCVVVFPLCMPTLALAVDDLGPTVGSQVPGFELVDQENETRSLSELMGTKGVVLAFYRSADW